MNNVFKMALYHRPQYYLTHPHIFIKHCGRAAKWAKQRLTRGYCDADTWDLDNYIAITLGDMFKHFAEHSTSYPSKLTSEEWREILLSISHNFEVINDEGYEDNVREAAKNSAFDLIKEYFWDLWD